MKSEIAVRALYESTLEDNYHFSQDERDAHLRAAREGELAITPRIRSLDDELFFPSWGVDTWTPQQQRNLKRRKQRLIKKINPFVGDLNTLNQWRKANKPLYNRYMDQLLFAQQLDPQVVENIEQGNSDWRAGYAAMIADYLPFIHTGHYLFTLEPFLEPLQEKIKAAMQSNL